MDAATRERYRETCHAIAARAGCTPAQVAAEALSLASAREAVGRARHVGCHLLAEGRPELERRLGVRPLAAERRRQWVRQRAEGAYLGGIWLLAAIVWALALLAAASLGLAPAWCVVAGLALIAPIVNISAALVDIALGSFAPAPAPLPRMAPSIVGSSECRALVVMPVLLAGRDDLAEQLEVLEKNFLNNPDAGLHFGLLTDFADAPTPDLPSDGPLLEALARGIAELNERHEHGPYRPFFYAHRARRPSAGEGCFMGWERKRGKIDEFNRLLGGANDTSFVVCEAAAGALHGVRYVITLDADNLLVPGAAAELVATIHHPLNRPRFDASGGRVVAGHGLLQPRVEFAPRPRQSLLWRHFLGPSTVGVSTLREVVSCLPQDLFGAAHFMGKGVYDVAAFTRVAERLPEGRVLSHDRLEGMYLRTGYASNVVVLEGFPADTVGWLRRWHRWARGDWQVLAWAFPRVPTAAGPPARNVLRPLDRWTLLTDVSDRSHAPACFALLLIGWVLLRQGVGLWTLGVTLASQYYALVRGVRRLHRAMHGRPTLAARAPAVVEAVAASSADVFLGILFFAEFAIAMADAAARSLYRLTVSHKHLLQWTAQAQVDRQRRGALGVLKGLWAGPAIAVAIGVGLALVAPSSLSAAAPLLLFWLLAPAVVLLTGSRPALAAASLPAGGEAQLRALARRAWALYEQPGGQSRGGLPPEQAGEGAELDPPRTSSNEIAFLLLATLGAYDLGYLSVADFTARVEGALREIERLERHRGHLFTGYTLPEGHPLSPRRVSAEQSAWLAGALYALEQGLAGVQASAAVAPALARGLADVAAVLRDVWGDSGAAQGAREGEAIGALCAALEGVSHDPARAAELAGRAVREFDGGAEGGGEGGAAGEGAAGEAAREGAAGEGDAVAFWWGRLREQSAMVEREVRRVASLGARPGEADAIVVRCAEAAGRARRLREEIDFGLFSRGDGDLLQVSYGVDDEEPASGVHQRLASVGRLAGFFAMAAGDLPWGHWQTLDRGATPARDHQASLNDYLMPWLLTRAPADSLLRVRAEAELEAQIALATRRKTPWGFEGVARDEQLGEPLVVAPFVSLLSLRLRGADALANLGRLKALGALGPRGLFASVELRPEAGAVVDRTYRPSHQAAAIVAVVNALADDLMVRRVHAHARVARLEFLLYEAPPES